MAAFTYRGSINHTEKTIDLLYRTQYRVYEKPRMLIRFAVGFAFVLVAVIAAVPLWARGIALLLGAWMIVSRDFPAQVQADRAVQARRGSLPKMEYLFYDDRIKLSGEGSMDIKYKKLSHLTYDADYLYMFLKKGSACMVDKAEIKPQEIEEFMKFIAEKTGLEWQRDVSLLGMNLWDIRNIIKNRNAK